MKFEKNKKYFTVAVYVLICAVIITAFAVLCFNFKSVLGFISGVIGIIKPIIYGMLIAFVIYPIMKYFHRLFAFVEKKKPRKKLRNILSLVCAYLIVIAALVTFIARIVPQVVESYNDISSNAPEYVDNAKEWIDDLFDSLPRLNFTVKGGGEESGKDLSGEDLIPYELVRTPQLTVYDKRENRMFTELADLHAKDIKIDVSSDVRKALDSLYSAVKNSAPYVISAIGNAINEVKNFVVGLIISVYFLLTRTYLKAQLKKIICAVFNDKAKARVYTALNIASTSFIRFIKHRIFDALIVAIVYYLAFKILAVPYALLLSVIFGVLALIPFIGVFIAMIPSFFIVLFFDPSKLLVFFIVITVVSAVNWQVMSRIDKNQKYSLPVVYIIIAVIIMGGIFGVTGMFLATPLAITAKAIVNQRIAEKQKKTETTEKAGMTGTEEKTVE